jgi:hypothetical protein
MTSSPRWFEFRRLCILAWIVAATLPVAAIPDAAAQVTDSIPAALLLRAAGAANAMRTGGVVHAVVCIRPSRLLGVYLGRDEARTRAAAGGPTCQTLGIATEPAPSEPPMPASLAFRMAEAADAFRTGAPVWIAADTAYPHVVREVYTDSAPGVSPPGAALGGPYVTPPDFGLPMEVILPCPHQSRPYSKYPCGRWPDFSPIPGQAIAGIDLKLRLESGDSLDWQFSADSVDAIFFTMSAFDRFVAPYYARSYGPEYAAALRDSVEVAFTRRR